MKLNPCATALLMFVMSGLITSQALAMTDEEYQSALDAVDAKYQPTYDQAEAEGEDIKDDSATCIAEFGFDSEWGETKIVLDVPSVTFKRRDLKFDFVKTSFETKTIFTYYTVETDWQIKKIGFIKTKVPVIRKVSHDVKTKVPVFWRDTTSITIKVPEFSKHRKELKFKFLKLKKLTDFSTPCDREQERGDELSASVESAAAAHRAEVMALTRDQLLSKLPEMDVAMAEAAAAFDEGFRSLDEVLAECTNSGADPNTVRTEMDGVSLSLPEARAQLELLRSSALAELDMAKAEMEKALADITAQAA